MSSKQVFQFRNFSSLLVTLTGLVMLISGLVIYVMPEGRIAYWTDWQLATLDKAQWGTMHTNVSFVFFVAGLLHIYYNWRALLAYIKNRLGSGLALRRELAAALFLTALCLHGSIVGYAPFSSVMDLGQTVKKSWYAGQDVHPPFPHAELMTIAQLASKIDFSLAGALTHLHDNGFPDASKESTLKDLAADNDRSPGQIFEALMADDRVYQ